MAYSRISLDRRKDLPVPLLQKLASVQKCLPDKHRWKLWHRLLDIYRAWAGRKKPHEIIVQCEHQQQEEIRSLPHVEELQETLTMVQDWLPMSEDLAARTLCSYVLKLISPIEHPEILHQGLAILLSSGKAYYVRITAERLIASMKIHAQKKTTMEEKKRSLLEDASTRLVCALAEALATPMAGKVDRQCIEHGFSINEQRCNQALACGLLIKFSYEEDPVSSSMREYDTWYESPSAYADEGHRVLRTRQREEMQKLLQSILAQQSLDRYTQLVLLKTWFRAILSGDSKKLVREGDRVDAARRQSTDASEASTESTSQKQKGFRLAQGQNALRVLSLYDQCLSQGVLPDKGLYELVERAKELLPLHASIESPALREAAWHYAAAERAKDVQNSKKKWSAPNRISQYAASCRHGNDAEHKHTLPPTSNITPSNPFLGASLFNILRLAVQVGDMHLARALHLMLVQDPQFRWSPDDSDIARQLLQTLVDDALHISYDAEENMQNTVQLACDFYTRWRSDLYAAGVWPDSQDRLDSNIKRSRSHLDRRRPRRYDIPSTSILRILALNDNERSFDVTLDTFLLDSHTEVTPARIEQMVEMLLARGIHPRTTMKLQQLTEALAYSTHHKSLASHVMNSLHRSRKLNLVQYERVLAFDRVYAGLKKLGFNFQYHEFAAVLSAVYGGKQPAADTIVADMVNAHQEITCDSTSDVQKIVDFVKARSTHAKVQGILARFTAKTLSAVDAASMLASFIDLLREEQQFADATLVYEALRAITGIRGLAEDDQTRTLLVSMQKELAVFESQDTRDRNASPIVSPRPSPQVAAAQTLVSERVVHTAEIPEHVKAGQPRSPFVSSAPSFLASFFTQNEANQPEANQYQQPVLGFHEAAGHDSQAAAALENTQESTIPLENIASDQSPYAVPSVRTSASPPLPYAMSSQSYSTFASIKDRNPRTWPALSQEELLYDTPSLLRELSNLPQQFADMTIEQIVAWKRRCEIEYDAVRRQNAEVEQSRRLLLARADASRWSGWQEHQATPWY